MKKVIYKQNYYQSGKFLLMYIYENITNLPPALYKSLYILLKFDTSFKLYSQKASRVKIVKMYLEII